MNKKSTEDVKIVEKENKECEGLRSCCQVLNKLLE